MTGSSVPLKGEPLEIALLEAQKGDCRKLIEPHFLIRDESDSLVPFKFNGVQADYNQKQSLRDIICKPRKVGFTTKILADFYAQCVVRPNFQALVLTYDQEETEAMMRIVRLFHESWPEEMRPEVEMDKANGMSFPALKSYIEIQTAGGRRKGRGRTPSAILIDEFAQYDEHDAEEIYTSLIPSAPPWAPIIIQSTPRGVGNPFHSVFMDGLEQGGAWKPHFYPWMFLGDKHSMALGSRFALPDDRGQITLADDEAALIERWNRDNPEHSIGVDQIRWRRVKRRELRGLFPQEFPEDAVSCFISTSNTVFSTEELNRLLSHVEQPRSTRYSGRMKVYRRPEGGVAYVIGVDCGEGIVGRDNSAAVIGTTAGRVDTVIAGIWGETDFAQVCYDAAKEYNNAFVLNERQSGFTFQHVLYNSLAYRNVYRHTEGVKYAIDAPLGYPVTGGATGNNKRLIDTMRVALASDGFRCPDQETLRELLEYKIHRDGSYGAPVGRHDDRARASMLYLLGCQERQAQVTPGRQAQRQRLQWPEGVFA